MILRAQNLKMRCAHEFDPATVCAKPKTMSKLIENYVQLLKSLCCEEQAEDKP
jgi:hypothetical protein